MSLHDKLSIILVTSPIVSHPSIELIDKVISSFNLVTHLVSCSLIIVADGVKLGKFRPKRGCVTSEMIDNYHQFIQNLQNKVDASVADGNIWSRTQVVRMAEHVGFGHAVYHAVQMCQTEYVMVVQHDHPFSLEFSLEPVIKLLDSGQAIYVSLPISTVWRHVNRCSSLYQIELRDKSIFVDDKKFVPIIFWYDGTHIARRQSYIDLVFEGDMPSPVGQFIEDNFSHWVMDLLKKDYDKWSKIYSMFVYQPFEEEIALIYHLDGRRYKTDAERKEIGWGKNPGVDDNS